MYMSNHTVSILGNISSFYLIISLIRLTLEVMEGRFCQGIFFSHNSEFFSCSFEFLLIRINQVLTQDMYSSLLLNILKKKSEWSDILFFPSPKQQLMTIHVQAKFDSLKLLLLMEQGEIIVVASVGLIGVCFLYTLSTVTLH